MVSSSCNSPVTKSDAHQEVVSPDEKEINKTNQSLVTTSLEIEYNLRKVLETFQSPESSEVPSLDLKTERKDMTEVLIKDQNFTFANNSEHKDRPESGA